MRRELISTVQTKVDFLLSDAYKENLALYDTNKKYIAQIAERYSKDGDDFIEEVAYTLGSTVLWLFGLWMSMTLHWLRPFQLQRNSPYLKSLSMQRLGTSMKT